MASETSASNCKVEGEGLSVATVRQPATFVVTAHDATGEQRSEGGDTFFIAIRGASRVRAHVIDRSDGTYLVAYTPSVSGCYALSISLFGEPLPGSPFTVVANAPIPDVSKCDVRGEALTHAVSRVAHSFEVRFRDALGRAARAEDLDVFVEQLSSSSPRVVHEQQFEDSPVRCNQQPLDGSSGSGETMASLTPSATASPTAVPAAPSGNMDDEPRFLKSRVEVVKPLVMRESCELDSELVGQIEPSTMAIVHEERVLENGDVRARITPVDEHEGWHAFLDSWLHPTAMLSVDEIPHVRGDAAVSQSHKVDPASCPGLGKRGTPLMANRGTQRKLTHRQSSAERPIGPLARPVTASSKPSLKGKNLSHLSASGVSLSSRRWVSSRGSSRSQQTHSVRSPPQIQPLPRHHFASPYLRDLNASLLSKHQQAGSDVGQARQGEEKQTEGTKHGSVSLGTLRGGSKALAMRTEDPATSAALQIDRDTASPDPQEVRLRIDTVGHAWPTSPSSRSAKRSSRSSLLSARPSGRASMSSG